MLEMLPSKLPALVKVEEGDTPAKILKKADPAIEPGDIAKYSFFWFKRQSKIMENTGEGLADDVPPGTTYAIVAGRRNNIIFRFLFVKQMRCENE